MVESKIISIVEAAKAAQAENVAKPASETKAKASVITIESMTEHATILKITHRKDENGKTDFKASESGKNLMFAARAGNVTHDGAVFFVNAMVGVKK
jgi:hypothetical protein